MIRARKYVLEFSGLRISLEFPETEQDILRKNFYNQFENYWRDFLIKGDRVDWRLRWKFNREGLRMKLDSGIKWLEWLEEGEGEWILKVLVGLESFNFVLRQLWLKLFWMNEGLGLHGSAVEKDGLAYVFLANSGAGKSTTARILEEEGFKHLADDMVLLRKIDGEWVLGGSPVIEKEYRPVKWRGKKIKLFFLERSDRVKTENLSEKEKLKLMLGQVWVVDGNDFRFERMVDLIKEVNIRKLKTSLEYKDLIKEVI